MANFELAMRLVLEAEGVKLTADGQLDQTAKNPTGYVVDAGGPTRFGISKNANPDVDIENLTLDGAKKLYRARYWDAHNLDVLADPWAYFMFDSYVQHSPVVVKNWTSINRLSDAVWNRVRYYLTLKNWPTDGAGWMRRMANLRDNLGREYGVWS